MTAAYSYAFPGEHVPLEIERDYTLYRSGALLYSARFYPYFCIDGKTLKEVRVKFYEGNGVEDILKELNAE